MKVAVFHPGTQHSWQTATALDQLGRLEWYATSIFYDPARFPYSLERFALGPLARRMHAEFRRFSHPGLDPSKVRTVGMAEWAERIASRAGFKGLAKRLDAVGNRQFASHLAQDIADHASFALWGFSGSARATFALPQAQGRVRILDRTIGDFRRYNAIMAPIRQSHPTWFLAASGPVSAQQIAAEQTEYDLSDVILAGSRFAADTVVAEGGAAVAPKVRVLPYCFDEALFSRQPPPQPIQPEEPVRFLFVGQVNPRKGIHLLLETFAKLPKDKARLTVVGEMAMPRSVFDAHAGGVDYLPTVARADVPSIMASHHVLVFPSFFEGSALSLLEGLASGMALIQTQAAGNGVTPKTGIMLGAQPTAAELHDAMLEAIEDRDKLNAWRSCSQAAAQDYTFARYRENIRGLLGELERPKAP